ncbi:MBL fold metallo-hydrolase [bacterium]|nr:MBL fold metallo-hydrolase [bacterium]
MRVEFLGTGGFHPNERRHTACIMFPEIGLIFDAGTSAFRVPKKIQTDTLELFLTHAHLDHTCGLTYLITPPLTGQIEKLRLYGRPDVLAAVQDQLFSELVFPVPAPFEFHSIEDEGSLTLLSGHRLEWMKLINHPGFSTAYKITFEDQTFAYVTDTIVDETYKDFIRGVDTLVHECYFPDSKTKWANHTGHSHATPVAELANEAEVGRLIVVHVDPMDETDDPIGLPGMQEIFPQTIIAEDGLTLDL